MARKPKPYKTYTKEFKLEALRLNSSLTPLHSQNNGWDM
jgi:hypothetical protein